MNSLKNTLVAILLLGVSYGVYQILTTVEPKSRSTADFHAATEPEIEIPPTNSAPPRFEVNRGAVSGLAGQPQPPPFTAPEAQPPAELNPLNRDNRSGSSGAPADPPPWTQLPANQAVPANPGGSPPTFSSGNVPVSSGNTASRPPHSLPNPASSTPPAVSSSSGSMPATPSAPGFPQTSSGAFAPLGASTPPTQPGRGPEDATAIPAQASSHPVGLTSALAPLPTLESSLQTARQLVAAGQMRQALEELSSQLHNPELEMLDQATLYKWLDSLAGKVIYSGEHQLASQPHVVQPNETLTSLAEAWRVPPQLVYNLNRERIPNPFELAPGTELKQVSGPFRAELDLNRQTLTLFLNGLYAGRFRCVAVTPELPPGIWKVETKLESGHPAGQFLLQTNQPAVNLHAQPADGLPVGCCFSQGDARDLFQILSIGSEIKIIR